MKPFDLEKAKAGAPLVTRGGDVVSHFHYSGLDRPWPIVAYVGEYDAPQIYNEDGRAHGGLSWDLFLADPPKVKKSGWVAVGVDGEGSGSQIRYCTNVHSSKEAAINQYSTGYCAAAVEIHWEEEAP